ncbi:uncharacterized protein si:ch211-89o9.4 [Myxocyprinus asiaticus]|uniref:uncharacterized protein si:ch211-89o9.4 n=1 Tax=Myxocyprinus asiaticus TaxID=70543 RepID=UPI002223DBD8|nr:uncharacterized protein si:ch211-89o9.4 [Myxocyprinus asiaticus]
MKTTQQIIQNTGQRKRTSSSTSIKAGNTLAHAHEINTRPMPSSWMSSAFTSVPELFGTTQVALLKLAQLEAQLVLNLISNFAAGNHGGYGNPFVPLLLLQAVAMQRPPFLTMYQPQGVITLSHLLQRKNFNSVPNLPGTMLSSASPQKISSVIANKASGITLQGDFLAKEVIQEKILGLSLSSSKTTLPQPACGEPLVGSNNNHCGKNGSFKPESTNMTVPLNRHPPNVSKTWDSTQQAMLPFLPENLIKALASLGLSLEDLELLCHSPDNHLTTEMLPHFIQSMQQRKGANYIKQTSSESIMPGKVIEYGHASRDSSGQTESSRESSYSYGKHHAHGNQKIRHSKWKKSYPLPQSISPSSQSPALFSSNGHSCCLQTHSSNSSARYNPSDLSHEHFFPKSRALRQIRESTGRGSNSFLKRLQHGHAEDTKLRPCSIYFPSHSKCSIRHNFVTPDHNKTRNYATQKSLSSSHSRSTMSNTMRKGHRYPSFSSLKSGESGSESKPEATTESMNIQTPVTKKGVIRVSGILHDYPESELIKMTAPFGKPVEVLIATEVDMATHLEWKKALVILPTEFSAQEMVKVYSAIPLHMRQQSVELVSQIVDLSSPVSMFQAFVGPSTSNGLLTPLDNLLVVCNVPNQPCATTGVLRMLKPFGKVFRTLVFCGNKVDFDQCLWNNNCIQIVLEMESAAVALSVYEWSQKVPCLYHNHHLVFLRGTYIQKNISEVNSA